MMGTPTLCLEIEHMLAPSHLLGLHLCGHPQNQPQAMISVPCDMCRMFSDHRASLQLSLAHESFTQFTVESHRFPLIFQNPVPH